MSTTIETILREILSNASGNKIHVRMEMPYDWGVTLSGEIDDNDIAVSHEFDFAKYATEFKKNHSSCKYNIIDFTLTKNGQYEEKPIYDAAFQDAQDKL